jgi:hypothetical protein
MTRSRGTLGLLVILLGGCAGKSKSTGGDSSSGGTSGTGSSSGGTSGTGSSSGGTSGTGSSSGGTSGTGSNTGGTSSVDPNLCSSEDLTCEPSKRCELDLFGEARVFPAGPAPSSLELGDLNGDAYLDAVIAEEVPTNLVSLLGGGDGTFSPPVNSELIGTARDVALGDWDDDGWLDVVVPGPPARVSFGSGNGDFQGVGELDAVGDAVTTGDLDENGTLDIVLLSYAQGAARAYLGDGQRGFVGGASFVVGLSARDASLGYIDGDRRLDLAVINVDGDAVGVLLGNGDGTFSERTTFGTVGGDPWAILLGDWNGDRRLDVVTANDFGSNVSLFLGSGDGTFSQARTFSTGNGTGSLAAADFDRDGNLDLAVGNVGVGFDAVYVSVFLGDGSGEFAVPRVFRAGRLNENVGVLNLTDLASADLDADGYFDLVVLNRTAGELAVLLGTPSGRCVPE